MELFIRRSRGQTIPDQWQTQITLRVRMCASVIYISDIEDGIVWSMHMTPVHSIGEALTLARSVPGREALDIVMIPDGVSVTVNQKTSEA